MNAYYDKLVFITGGSSGIGLALAKQVFGQGASVFILAEDLTKLTKAQQEIERSRINSGQKLQTASANVAQIELLEPVITQSIASFGIPDFIINCAGVSRPGYFEELTPEIFKWTMDINFHGTVNVIKLFLPYLEEHHKGHIINFSSLAGAIGLFGYTAYGSSKYAIRGFSDALRAELKPKGIKISVVFPSDTDTPQLAWENQFKPSETRIIDGTAKPVSADFVASVVLKDAARGKYNIVPGFSAKLFFFVATHLGGIVYPVIDRLVRDAQKQS